MKKVQLTKQIIDNQLFLFANGNLIYKKWFGSGSSKLFHENEGLAQEVIDNEKRKNNKYEF